MIVKILSSTGSFNAVRYNTNKINTGEGELMKMVNMPFDINENISPEEVKTFLKAYSAQNKTEKPQFHVAISCKGNEMSKDELTNAAELYMLKMGYEKQPYLIVFHSDTDNNHVHIVSTRVKADNKLINNSFEKFKSLKAIREIERQLGKENTINKSKLKELLKYTLSTSNNLKVLLEVNGLKVKEENERLKIYSRGILVETIAKENINLSNQEHLNKKQFKAILRRYSNVINSDVIPVREKLKGGREGAIIGYESELSRFLKQKFGYEIVYHFKDDKPPFGYTFISHKDKAVLKGSEIYKLKMNLSKHLNLASQKIEGYNINTNSHKNILSRIYKIEESEIFKNEKKVTLEDKEYTRDLVNSYLEHKSVNDLKDIGIIIIKDNNELFLVDTNMKNIWNASDIILDINNNIENDIFEVIIPQIADDVDDEKVHGKRRNKKIRKR